MVEIPTNKVTYSVLPDKLKARLWKYRREAFLLDGLTGVVLENRVNREFAFRRKTKHAWKFLAFEYMRKIDRKRSRLGLAPIHFHGTVNGYFDPSH